MAVKSGGQEIHMYTVKELYDFVKDTPESHHSREYSNHDFCKYSWDEAITMLKYGWHEGITKMKYAMDKINAKLDEVDGMGILMDTEGDYLDIGSYLAGIPECFAKVIPAEGFKRIIPVYTGASVVYSISQDNIYNRGAAIMALVERLLMTHRVDLVVYEFAEDVVGSKHIEAYFHIDTDNDFSHDSMAFYVANQSFLRRIMFSLDERVFNRSNCGGYGSVNQNYHPELPKDCIHFPAMKPGAEADKFATIDKAKEEVQRILNKVAEDDKRYKLEAEEARV
jgi:hypothetical protein